MSYYIVLRVKHPYRNNELCVFKRPLNTGERCRVGGVLCWWQMCCRRWQYRETQMETIYQTL